MQAIQSSYLSAFAVVAKRSPYKLIVGLFLLINVFLVGCQTEPTEFLEALRDGNDSVAFALLNAELQKELGGKDGFEEWADTWRPETWLFGSKCSADQNEALAKANGRLASGERFLISIYQGKVEETWLIQGIEISTTQVESWGTPNRLDCLD